MTNENNKITFADLLKRIESYLENDKEIEVIKQAYEYANNKHTGQKRLDGSDFIEHPLNVAYIMTDLSADYTTIATALLHEIIDEGNTPTTEIKNKFGEEIAKLVDSITKINRLSFSAESEWTIIYYRKILVGLCEDVRVIFIKLGDRLHNMRTLWAIPEHKQKEKAKETMEILAPIAHHLGIYNIKSELEDLSLRYYKPDIYLDIVKTLNNTKLEREKAIEEMKLKISEMLHDNNINHEIKGRSKSIFSIYQKLQKGKKFKEIYDILALRVYVETEQNCYLALGLIHSKFKPLPKRFKDYVAMPKENMYQSLHTTIFGIDGHLFEIQIRTYEMDQIAEYGIASHWSYKDKGNNKLKGVMEQKLEMFRSLIDLNNEERNPEEFVRNVESEVLNDNIYLFTPKGDVIELPVGSTPIDFAYRVHTEVGEKMIGAIVNDNIVPLDYQLQDGDIVKVNTNKNAKGPSHEWINIAKTAQAKTKIKNFFSRIDKDETIKKGEETLLKELRKQNKTFNEFLSDENLDIILEELNLDHINDIYYAIGSNKYTANNIINIIYKENKTKENIILDKLKSNTIKSIAIKNDVLVEGIDEVKITLANCCGPIKGDNIIGYITKGKGITVHRVECHNVSNLEERIIDVTWNDNVDKKWPTNLVIEAEKKDNFLLELLSKTANSNVSIQSINTINNPHLIKYDLVVLAENTDKLKKFMNDIEQIPNVHKVERIIK
jgi:GTP pyrophosphokinase